MSELKEDSRPKVTVSVGMQVNLGDFNLAKVQFSLQDDVKPGESIDDAFERVYAIADDHLAHKIQTLNEK